jgi:hypothetical protein
MVVRSKSNCGFLGSTGFRLLGFDDGVMENQDRTAGSLLHKRQIRSLPAKTVK